MLFLTKIVHKIWICPGSFLPVLTLSWTLAAKVVTGEIKKWDILLAQFIPLWPLTEANACTLVQVSHLILADCPSLALTLDLADLDR